jgi:hypothetical protein
MLAEIAANSQTGSTHAASLLELLTPFRGRLLAVVLGLASLGAADRYLGMLSTLLGRWDEAVGHFEQAVAVEERSRGRALLPRTRYWQARLHVARNDAGDRASAAALLDVVVAETSELGMKRLRQQAEELKTVMTGGRSPGA